MGFVFVAEETRFSRVSVFEIAVGVDDAVVAGRLTGTTSATGVAGADDVGTVKGAGDGAGAEKASGMDMTTGALVGVDGW